MKTIYQSDIASALGVSVAYINQLVKTKKRPNWKRAKQLADFTNTKPELWLEGTEKEIVDALHSDNNNLPNKSHSLKIEAD